MTRIILLICVSVQAGFLFHTVTGHSDSSPAVNAPLTTVNTSANAAIELRALTSTTRPSKLWDDDLASFVSTHPGPWIVGHCAHPCLSEPEAANEARADAAESAWTMIISRFQQTPPDAQWLHKQIIADVLAGRFDADALPEKFDRPYGMVWTESILLDLSPQRVDSILSSHKPERIRARHDLARTRTVAIISIAGAWLGFFFFNAITRGYFTTRLTLAAMLLTAAGVALLV